MTQATPGLAAQVDWRLYFVTDTDLSGGPGRVPHVVESAVLGGAGVVQVRDKHLTDRDFLDLTRECVRAARRAEQTTGRATAIVVNDRLDVAEELGLHVHLGQGDGSVAEARRRLGRDLLIGLSVSDDAELAAELADPTADVVGLSPIWATPTKTDAAPALGLNGAARMVRAAAARATTVGIGGINAANARDVIATGVDGICVVSAIAAAPDPRAAAAHLVSLWRTP